MTLDTQIAVRLTEECPLKPEELLDKAIELLCEVAGGDEWLPDRHPRIEDRESWRSDGTRRVGTVLGQGFYAITEVRYRPGGAIATQDMTKRELEVATEEERWHEYGPGGDFEEYADQLGQPRCMYELSMDSAYGTRTQSGLTAGGLHLLVGVKLQEWLNGMGGSSVFYDECAGEWFDMSTEDSVIACAESMLKSWGSNSGQAVTWFQQMVVPAMEAQAGGKVEWFG
jgi:hypothetical protein